MSDGGFLPEQAESQPVAPEAAPAPETAPEATPEGGAEIDEYVQAEREAKRELAAEQEEGFLEARLEEAPTTQVAAPAVAQPQAEAAPVEVDEVTKEVSKILEEGLEGYYDRMPPDAKERFQKKGVEVSTQIANMVRVFKVKAKRVVLLIREWLMTIPGVNKFFIEQEAKIKTDRILQLEEARKQDVQNRV